MTEYPWRRVLDMSTAYVSLETNRVLDTWTVDNAPLMFAHTSFGWFIWCPEEWDASQYGAIPADLKRVLVWAREQGAEYVLFDADGYDGHAALPTFEW